MPIDVTDKYIRVRVAKPSAFDEDSFRTTWINRSKGIKAIVGKKKGKSSTSVQSYLFDKEKWSVGEAKKWVKSHGHTIQADHGDGVETEDVPVYEKYAGEDAIVAMHDDEILSNVMSVKLNITDPELNDESGDILFEGYAVTDTYIEERKLRIPSSSWAWDGAFDLYNGRVLGFHDDRSTPIGKVDEHKVVKGKGLHVKGRIFAENPPLVLRAVRSRVLESFSVGFKMLEWKFDEKTQILTTVRNLLKELSVVNIPADSDAGFVIKNSLDPTEKASERSLQLPSSNENVTLEQLESTKVELGGKFEELTGIISTVREEQRKFSENAITKDDLQERMTKILADVETIGNEVQEIRQANRVANEKVVYLDYRSMITEFSWLTDDNGNKLGDIAQRAYCLFQMPVDYDKMRAGQELKNLRDLHDASLLADAMLRFRKAGRPNYTIQGLNLYKELVKNTDKFDHEVALAMAGGNTGYGAEWVPEELSSEFNEYLRQTPTLANRFETWNMPKGGSAKFPFQNGKAVVYKGSEALVDNATEARKTNIATEVKTFTPDVFIGALISSEELTEDAILDMVAFIRKELSMALDEGRESAIINGDDSTTHFDNTVDTIHQTYDVETCFKGLRKLGQTVARDIEVSSSTTGVGALELINFTDAKMDMGVAGLKPSDCMYVTGIKGKGQTQTALYKEDALGVLAFMISGTLPTIDGSEIFVSALYDEALDSAGIRNSGADVKHTSMMCVHKPSFRLAQRRGITIEYNKNILTQQQQFVVTARWDFGKICADAIVPVVGMENIQHTA